MRHRFQDGGVRPGACPDPAPARRAATLIGTRPLLTLLCLLAGALTGACARSGDLAAGRPSVAEIAAAVQIVAAPSSLAVGQQGQVVALARDGAGKPLPSYPLSWATSDSTIAGVDSTGLVTGISQGSADISAVANGLLATARVSVFLPGADQSVGVVFSDDFEGGYGPQQNGAGWTNTAPVNVTISSDVAHSGSNSLRFRFPGKVDCLDASAEQRFAVGRPLRELWLEYWIYFPAGGEGGSARYASRTQAGCPSTADNNKLLSLFGPVYNGETTLGLQSWSSRNGQPGDARLDVAYSKAGHNGVWFYPGANADPFVSDADRGHWLQLRVHVRLADVGVSNGHVQVWKNGALILNADNLDWYDSTGQANYIVQGYLMGWSNSGFTDTTYVYIDDVSIMDRDPGW